MKSRNPFADRLFATLFFLALAGCGGGGGGGGSAGSGGSVGTSETDAGSISARFTSGATPRYMRVGYGSAAMGNATPLVQNSNGAITTLGTYSLSGTSVATHDIAGDAAFALGRWVSGTVMDGGTAIDPLEGGNGYDNWHYVVYNVPSALPSATINTTCDSGVFTTATYQSGTTSTMSATTTGSATLTFAGGVAYAGVTLLSTSGSASNTVGATTSWSSVGVTYQVGVVVTGSGTWLTLAEGDGGAYRIVGLYTTALSNGVHYQGVYSFKCTPV